MEGDSAYNYDDLAAAFEVDKGSGSDTDGSGGALDGESDGTDTVQPGSESEDEESEEEVEAASGSEQGEGPQRMVGGRTVILS